jgi:hypothetical protein
MRLKTRNGIRHCGLCGKEYPATTEHFYQKKDGSLTSECRSCVRQRSSENQKVRHHAGGVKYHLAFIARSAKLRARKQGLTYDIDADYLATLLQRQKGLCAVSQVPMTFAKGTGHVPTNASIDRIDPNAGYTRKNVQLVAHQVNTMKSNLGLAALAEWCRLILAGVGSSMAPVESHEFQD